MGSDCLQQIHECIEIALDCVGSDEKTRPGIAQISLRLAQIGQELAGKKLLRCTASRRGISMDEQEPVMSKLDKSTDISSPNSEVDVSDSTTKVNKILIVDDQLLIFHLCSGSVCIICDEKVITMADGGVSIV